jgi:hypothetical protein
MKPKTYIFNPKVRRELEEMKPKTEEYEIGYQSKVYTIPKGYIKEIIKGITEQERQKAEKDKIKIINDYLKFLYWNKWCLDCYTTPYGDGNCHCKTNNWDNIFIKKIEELRKKFKISQKLWEEIFGGD